MPVRLIALRLLPLVLLLVAAGFWVNDVQDGGEYVLRNWIPFVVLFLLAALTLQIGRGRRGGIALRMTLGTVGFALPALGLSLYLHYAYSINLNGMFSDATYPDGVFAYLPLYTVVAGAIGFAIGWIVARNV